MSISVPSPVIVILVALRRFWFWILDSLAYFFKAFIVPLLLAVFHLAAWIATPLTCAYRYNVKLLDRYIIRLFLIHFVILTFVILMLFVLVDLMFDLDEFMKGGEIRAAKHGGSTFLWTLWTIADYYGPMLLFIYVYLSGLLVVAAMGFAFAAMGRARELVTIVASGISMYRIAAPILVVGALINGLTLLDQELAIPQMAGKLARRKSEVKHDQIRTFAIHYVRDAENRLLSAARFDAAANAIESVTILERNKDGRKTGVIRADRGVWNSVAGHWELVNGVVTRAVQPDDSATEKDAALGAIESPIDVVKTDVSPQVLMARRATIYPALLSMNELGRLMNNPVADTARILRIMHGRFSLMVVNILILVLCLPFFLTRVPGNPMVQAVKATVFGLGAWITCMGILNTPTDAINPVVMAWLPVVLLLPASAILLQRIKT